MSLEGTTTPEMSDAFAALTLRVEAIEAFILRRPTEPIPHSIIEQAIADRHSDAEPEWEPEP